VAPLDEVLGWRGATLYDEEGRRIGTIGEVYLDADSKEPEWALVHTGRLGTGRSFVPLRGAQTGEDGPTVPFAKDLVEDAPGVDPDGQLTKREEAELYRHYGLSTEEA
jgi:sporulation protein YlmC with PRC-barrel domain